MPTDANSAGDVKLTVKQVSRVTYGHTSNTQNIWVYLTNIRHITLVHTDIYEYCNLFS